MVEWKGLAVCDSTSFYLDESGDLGFSGGGTPFFTIAFIVTNCPHILKRRVKATKRKYGISGQEEMKGNTTRREIKMDFLERIATLPLEIHAITVCKDNVAEKLREDTNILYNYMTGLLLPDRIRRMPKNARAIVVVDKRVTSLPRRLDFDGYLKSQVWLEGGRDDIDLDIYHEESHRSLAIQGIDIVVNSVFRKACGDSELYDVIRDKIVEDRRLFFSKKT
ncbi:DUF3800 domain-containing protein [Planctomycetota bacterium]